ncbi:hypothetical protein DMENIID0001_141160 [Sergentomyia squamirostris]
MVEDWLNMNNYYNKISLLVASISCLHGEVNLLSLCAMLGFGCNVCGGYVCMRMHNTANIEIKQSIQVHLKAVKYRNHRQSSMRSHLQQ